MGNEFKCLKSLCPRNKTHLCAKPVPRGHQSVLYAQWGGVIYEEASEYSFPP